MRQVSASELARGPTVEEALQASTLAGARVLAGAGGVDRVVEHMSVMEQPDILPWVKAHELLLTTGYPLRHANGGLPRLVDELHACGLAGVAIKLGPYISVLPAPMLERADELGLPIIQLPDNAAFDEILNEVLSKILDRQAATLALSEQVHRALTQVVLRDGGLQEIASVVAELLGGAVAIIDPRGELLASVDWDQIVALLADEGLVSEGRLRLDHVDPGVFDVGGGHTLVVPISAGESQHGHIVFAERDRPIGVADVHALENAATVAALAITKTLAVTAVESKYRADLLHELIHGPLGRRSELLARASALDWDLDRPVVAMVIGCPGERSGLMSRPTDRQISAAKAVARAHDPGAGVADFRDGIVILVGAASRTGASVPDHAIATELQEAIGVRYGRRISVGISRPVTDVREIRHAYGQAHRALTVGAEFLGRDVTHYDDLGIYCLLTLIPQEEELTRFAHDVLGPLASQGEDAADLRATLDALFSTNFNVAEAARLLHFHYNTVRYRLEKLEHVLGPFRRDTNHRLSLQVALRIVQMTALQTRVEGSVTLERAERGSLA